MSCNIAPWMFDNAIVDSIPYDYALKHGISRYSSAVRVVHKLSEDTIASYLSRRSGYDFSARDPSLPI